MWQHAVPCWGQGSGAQQLPRCFSHCSSTFSTPFVQWAQYTEGENGHCCSATTSNVILTPRAFAFFALQCEKCNLHFRHKSQLRLHLRQKHGAITNTKVQYRISANEVPPELPKAC